MDGEERARGIVDDVVAILRRGRAVEWLDESAGRLRLVDGERVVLLDLPPALVRELAEQLGDGSLPELADATPDQQDRVRARYLAIWISELVESDLHRSLRRVVLARSSEGTLLVEGIHDPDAAPWSPPTGEGLSWTADRPGSDPT